MLRPLNFLLKLVKIYSRQQKKKLKHFRSISDHTFTNNKNIRSLEGTWLCRCSRSATTNNNIVPAGPTCGHSKQTGLRFCSTTSCSVDFRATPLPQSILPALLWNCELDFCTRSGKESTDTHMCMHAQFACLFAQPPLYTLHKRAIGWSGQWHLADLDHVFCILNFICAGSL